MSGTVITPQSVPYLHNPVLELACLAWALALRQGSQQPPCSTTAFAFSVIELVPAMFYVSVARTLGG